VPRIVQGPVVSARFDEEHPPIIPRA